MKAVVGKLYMLPKIHKYLSDVSRRPVISNCGTSTGKASEILHFHINPTMRNARSCIRDSSHFLGKN